MIEKIGYWLGHEDASGHSLSWSPQLEVAHVVMSRLALKFQPGFCPWQFIEVWSKEPPSGLTKPGFELDQQSEAQSDTQFPMRST